MMLLQIFYISSCAERPSNECYSTTVFIDIGYWNLGKKWRYLLVERLRSPQPLRKSWRDLLTTVKLTETSMIARFMGPTWGPSGADRPRWALCWLHELCYLGCRLANITGTTILTSSHAKSLQLTWRSRNRNLQMSRNGYLSSTITCGVNDDCQGHRFSS